MMFPNVPTKSNVGDTIRNKFQSPKLIWKHLEDHLITIDIFMHFWRFNVNFELSLMIHACKISHCAATRTIFAAYNSRKWKCQKLSKIIQNYEWKSLVFVKIFSLIVTSGTIEWFIKKGNCIKICMMVQHYRLLLYYFFAPK